MNILLIVVLIVVIISLIIYKYKTQHTFWVNHPVMKQYNRSLYKIGQVPRIRMLISEKYSFKYNDSIDKIYTFINTFFSKEYSINQLLFNYYYTKRGAKNISLYKDSFLIGFIHSHDINLIYNKRSFKINYVDYLCVNTNTRNQNIAAILISSLLNSHTKDSYYIFKKERSTLPYSPILSTDYFYKKIAKVLIKPIENNIIYDIHTHSQKIKQVYSFYIDSLSKYSLYNYDNYEEFYNKYITLGIVQLFVIENNNKIINIIIGNKVSYKTYVCFEIDFILGDLNKSQYIHEQLSNILSIYRCDYYSIVNIGNMYTYIKKNNLYKSYKMYFYTYNINIPLLPKETLMLNMN
tara:strand:+ start:2016 stop:3065 length:1050 start_codon:yes stop_codon:yes gene_type:complete